MIPYFPVRWTYVTIGGRPYYLFGWLAACALVCSYIQLLRRGKELGLRRSTLEAFMFWMVLVGLLFAHWFELLLYQPALILQRPIELLLLHHGLSSYGGLLGTLVGGLGYLRWKRVDPWKFADAWCYAFPFGWLVARAGCAMVHDHPGRLSPSFLAVQFPRGPRFDLGLMEFALTPFLVALVVFVAHRYRRPGAVSGVLAVSYALMRFPLDFLRATDLGRASDPRYWGLTPAQWSSLLLVVLGGYLLHHAKNHADYAAQKPIPTL